MDNEKEIIIQSEPIEKTEENHELEQLEIMNEKLDEYIKSDSEKNDKLLLTIEEFIMNSNEEKGNNEQILSAIVESNATPEDVQAVSYYSDLITIVIFGAVVPIALSYKLIMMVISPLTRHIT